MEWHFTTYSILALFVTGLLAFFALLPWQRRNLPGGKPLAWFLAAIAIWTMGAAFENAVVGESNKVFWGQVSYFGTTASPILLLSFALEYSSQKTWSYKNYRWLVWLVPLVTLGLAWTNSRHHLIWTAHTPVPGQPYLLYQHGPWFWIFIVYSYLVILYASLVLVRDIFRKRSIDKLGLRQSVAILIGIIIPWVSNIIYVFDLAPFRGLDLTPLGFSVVGGILAWSLFGLKMFDLAPLARSAMIEIMDDCLLVIDQNDRIRDLNPAARNLLEHINPDRSVRTLLGAPKDEVLAAWPELLEFLDGEQDLRGQISLASCFPVPCFDVRVPRLGDINDNFLGKVVILHDITNLKTAQDQALRSRDIAEALVVTGITLNSALELNEVLNLILDQISRVLDFDYGSFQAIKDNDLEVVAVRGFEQPEAILGLHYTISGHSPNRDAILERRPVRIADIRHFDNFLLRQFAPDICSYIAVPILAKDKVTGILALYSKETNHFTEEDQRISESFAGQVAIAVENAHIFEQIREMATTDTLTGLYNRRQFYTMAEIELARSTRYNKPMTIMVIDLDHFKKVNDTYGHAAGDITLRNIARLCQLVLRKIDLVGRLGGEEFGVLLPETSLKDALIAAERLRETIANTTIEFKGDEIAVTASIGAAQSFGLDDTLEAILERADYALYEAKEAGRNQIHLYQAVERPLAVELP